MNRMELVIFDLDGTIIDSIADLTDATNYMLDQMGKPNLPVESVRRLVGQGARRLVERALPTASVCEIDHALTLFLAYNASNIVRKTTLYPGVRETLYALSKSGRRLAVLSNKNAVLCNEVINALGVGQFFHSVIGADSLPFRKPSPEPVLKLVDRFRIPVEKSVIVGDSINDVTAGKGAGVVTVGCTYGYGDREELREADFLIATFSELLSLPIFECGSVER